MATGTDAGGTWNTTAGNKTVTATPASGDLIVVVHGMSGWASGDDSTITDDNSDGLGTYYKLGTATAPLSTGGGTAGALWISVRNSLVGSASSTIFTATNSGDTGGGLTVLRFSGMTFAGVHAIRQYIGESSQTESPPTVVFAEAPLTTNPVVIGILGEDVPLGITVPSGFTVADNASWAIPATGLGVIWDDSGQTSATLSFSGGSLTDHNEVGVELDAAAGKPLVQSGQTTLAGTLAISGDLSYKFGLVQSGQVTVSGVIGSTGDLTITAPASTLELTQSGSIDVAGVIATAGDITYKWAIEQSGSVAQSGVLAFSGDLSYKQAIVQTGETTLTGVLALPGEVELIFTVPASSLELVQTGSIDIAGVLDPSGDISYKFALVQSGEVSIAGQLAFSGDLSYAFPVTLEQTGSVDISGQVALSGDLSTKQSIVQTGEVAVAGQLALSGDILPLLSVPLVQQDQTAVQGQLAFSGDPRAVGWKVYWAQLEVPAATGPRLTLEQTGQITLAGVLGSTGDLSYKFGVSQSGEVVLAGQAAFSGDLTYGGWKLYWTQLEVPAAATVSLTLVQSGSIDIAGVIDPSGDLSYKFAFEQSGSIGISGQLGMSGDPGVRSEFAVEQTGSVDLSGVLALQGDAGPSSFVRLYWFEIVRNPIEIEQSSPIELNGTLGLSGDLGGQQVFDLTQSGELVIAGILGLAGDPSQVTEFALEQRRPLAMTGQLAFEEAKIKYSKRQDGKHRARKQNISSDDQDLMDIAPFLMALAESECC